MVNLMGKHYLLNLYECSLSSLDDELFLCNLIKRAAVECGANVLQTMSHHFEPQGVTAICLLSESHISIHTWPEKGEAAVDVFTCGESQPRIACDLIIKELNSLRYDLKFIQR